MNAALTEAEEARADLTTYGKAMLAGNLAVLLSIEEKYGLLGATPEMVSTALHDIANGEAK